MNIGIFGGTFNPPHLGHRNMLIESSKILDEVIIIPNQLPVHKRLPQNTASVLERLEMCEIMSSDVENAHVSDIEIASNEPSYTVLTLEKFSKVFSCDKLFLIIGSDSFFNIELWYKSEEILKLATLLVFSRDISDNLTSHKNFLEENYGAKIVIVNADICKVSSSEIRDNEKKDLLQPEIIDYIKNNNLYGEQK